MKLILTAAVENLGVPGDIVEVKNGYGRNYLLPRNLAIVATRGAEKQIATMKRAQEERAIRDLDHAREVKEQLEALTLCGLRKRVRSSVRCLPTILPPPLRLPVVPSWTNAALSCRRVP